MSEGNAGPVVRVALRVGGEPIAVEVPCPPEPARADELLPLFRAIADAAVGRAVARSGAAGRPVSCRKGCAACCRAQPVPVTPPEAYALLRLVERLPGPRREAIRARFADRVERLRAAGLRDVLFRRDAPADREAARDLATRYLALGLSCPFLEDDACSIYEERPFVCRQYLVTTPPALCDDPLGNPVAVVPVPIRPAHAMLDALAGEPDLPRHTVPLVLALELAETHREALERRHAGAELARRWLAALAEAT
jgi:Fe-S-cluster containining protein